jgi:hypothetical protein
LEIKMGSPTFPTYIVHNTKFAGYIPSRRAFERGGYETKAWNSGKFLPGALELIAQTAVETLESCFGPRVRTDVVRTPFDQGDVGAARRAAAAAG